MTAFTRSLRALQADRSIASSIAMAIAVALLAAWGTWAARARVALDGGGLERVDGGAVDARLAGLTHFRSQQSPHD